MHNEQTSHYRKDPVTGRWVIIDPSNKQPNLVVFSPKNLPPQACILCAGRESSTPPEILAYRPGNSEPNSPNWWLRTIPNPETPITLENDLDKWGDGMYDFIGGFGASEIIIETPYHNTCLHELNTNGVAEVFWAAKQRYQALSKDSRFKYIMMFKNQGLLAGAAYNHSHSQIVALPIVPKRIKEEIYGAARYFDQKERCVFCDIIHHATNVKEDYSSIVTGNDSFVAMEYFASRMPYETLIIPLKHTTRFSDITEEEIHQLASIVKEMLTRLSNLLCPNPDHNILNYNMIIHDSPISNIAPNQSKYYHWHIELVPKSHYAEGFELGTGFWINPVAPELAARQLKDVKI